MGCSSFCSPFLFELPGAYRLPQAFVSGDRRYNHGLGPALPQILSIAPPWSHSTLIHTMAQARDSVAEAIQCNPLGSRARKASGGLLSPGWVRQSRLGSRRKLALEKIRHWIGSGVA